MTADVRRRRAELQGRLIDHLRNTQLVGLEDLQVLVLDEADRLLGMGFTDEVRSFTNARSARCPSWQCYTPPVLPHLLPHISW